MRRRKRALFGVDRAKSFSLLFLLSKEKVSFRRNGMARRHPLFAPFAPSATRAAPPGRRAAS